jgi:hypothetical protein
MCNVQVLTFTRQLRRGATINRSCMTIRTMFEQELHDVQVAVLRRAVQGCQTQMIRRFDLGSGIE